jgi:hypothetical protein
MNFMEAEPKGEVFHRSPAMHWEIFPSGNANAVIHRVRFFGGTIFLVTDRLPVHECLNGQDQH